MEGGSVWLAGVLIGLLFGVLAELIDFGGHTRTL